MTAGPRKIIDVHSHAIPNFLREDLIAANRSPSLSRFPDWSPELALDIMSRFGVERTMLSVSTPGVHFGNDVSARVLARRYNEYCASLGSRFKGRFGAFAALPLPDIEGACEEVAYALDVLQLDGVGILASYNTFFLGSAVLAPLMTELNARNAIVFVHPAGHPTSRTLPLDYPLWMLEYPIDTTRAAVNLIMSGTTSTFSKIKFILAHNGGALPFLAWRLASASLIDHRYAHMSEMVIRDEIRKFYYEIAQSPGDEALGSLLQVTNPDHILFGSDWPYCRLEVVKRIIDTFECAQSISDENRQSIFYDNAVSLLK